MVEFKIFLSFMFILLFNITKNDHPCPEEKPRLKPSISGSYAYCCTENELGQNEECILIKMLNNIVSFEIEDNEVFNIIPIQMPNNDIIFISLIYLYDNECFYCLDLLIYGLKSSGEVYVNKIISSIIFYYYQITALQVTINNKHYPLLCDVEECKLIDIENDYIYYQYLNEFLQINEDLLDDRDYPLSIINMDNKNKILFTYSSWTQKYLSINKINNIELTSFKKINKANENTMNLNDRQFSDLNCFITKKNFIECLYIEYIDDSFYYSVAVYNELLNYLGDIRLEQNGFYYDNYIENSIHIIYLKNEIGVFSYFIKDSNNYYSVLRMKINELYFNENEPKFKNVIKNRRQIDINQVIMNNNSPLSFKRILQNARPNSLSLIKINDNKFAYAYNDYNDITLIIFEIYGTNYDNLFSRYYTINLDSYNIYNINNQKLFMHKDFLGIGFDYANNLMSTSFIIFGYSSKNINIIILNIYQLNQGFLFEPKNYFSIDNNVFGYDLNIKISSYSNTLRNIRFFSINDRKEIKKNELINLDDSILFDFSCVNKQIGKKNEINFMRTISSPDYDKLIEFSDNQINYGDEEYYKSLYKTTILEEKIFTLEINFVCYESSISCNYPDLTIKTCQNDLNNLNNFIYFANFIYEKEENNLLNAYLSTTEYNSNEYCNNDTINSSLYNYLNKCINECPIDNDNPSNNCKFMCQNENQYIFNFKCYDNCPEGTIPDLLYTTQKICKCENLYYTDENNNQICLSSSMVCDENHPVLDELSGECLNYRVKYDSEYYYECPENTCISQRYESLTICEEKTSDMNVINGVCFNNYISLINNFKKSGENNIKVIEQEGVALSLYSYDDYSQNFEKILQNNTNTTLIDLRECLSVYKEHNNLDENIYISIVDTPKIFSNETTNRFNFELYFENMTKINDLDICKDIKMNVYSPITNQKIKNIVNIGKIFYGQGEYNIFNKNDKFYKDICSGANINNNDITLNDRYIDIYPHDLQICPKDCECLGINYTTNTLICNCDIILSNEYSKDNYKYQLMTNDDIKNLFKDYNNLLVFFTDMINYKIVKCFQLLFFVKNYKNNISFYIGIVFFVISLSLLIIFIAMIFEATKTLFYNHLKKIVKENKLIKSKKEKIDINNGRFIDSKMEIEKKEDVKNELNNSDVIKEKDEKNIENIKLSEEVLVVKNNKIRNKVKHKTSITKRRGKRDIQINNINLNSMNCEEYSNSNKSRNPLSMFIKDKHKRNTVKLIKEEKKMNGKEINQLPYYKAKDVDDRHFFLMLYSILTVKIELIHIVISPDDYTNRCLLFNIYLLNCYIDLLLNCLFYNDYAISQKYHCNGHLEFITSLIMSLLSNIFTYILTYLISYLTNYPSIIDAILKEVKNIKTYNYITKQLRKVMITKFESLLIIEILLGLFMVYYLFIFNVINSKSINSFLLNYLYSQLESLLYALSLSLIVSLLRKISLLYNTKRLYIISSYINEHF